MATLLLGRTTCKLSALRLTAWRPANTRQVFRTFTEDSKENLRSRVARRKTLRERAMEPPGEAGKEHFILPE